MSTPAQIVEQGIQNGYEHARDRQEEIEDEKRKGQLKTLLEDATTPQDRMAAYDAVYHKDPGVLKQHVENLTRRITGKTPQPVVNPQQAEASRVAALGPRAQTPEQQQLAAYQAQLAAGNKANLDYDQQQAQQKNQATVDLIRKYAPPDQQAALLEDFARKQAGITAALKNIPGAAGQPYKTPNGTWVRPIQNADGTIAEQPMPAGWTPPAPKPGSPAVQYTNLLSKKLLADAKKGPPLTAEEVAQLQAAKSAMTLPGISRADAWAQAAAANNLIAVTDPNTGMDTLVPRAQAVAAAKGGSPYLAGAVSAPTGMDKKNQMLAQSALTQIDTMEGLLKSDPSLTGPGAGQFTAFTNWIGSNSEDAQQFLAAATFLSEHGVGVFGGRNIHSIEDLQNLFGSLKTNPKALYAALEQARQTMSPWATAGGRLPSKGPAPKKVPPKSGVIVVSPEDMK